MRIHAVSRPEAFIVIAFRCTRWSARPSCRSTLRTPPVAIDTNHLGRAVWPLSLGPPNTHGRSATGHHLRLDVARVVGAWGRMWAGQRSDKKIFLQYYCLRNFRRVSSQEATSTVRPLQCPASGIEHRTDNLRCAITAPLGGGSGAPINFDLRSADNCRRRWTQLPCGCERAGYMCGPEPWQLPGNNIRWRPEQPVKLDEVFGEQRDDRFEVI